MPFGHSSWKSQSCVGLTASSGIVNLVGTLRLRDRAEDRTWSSDSLCSAVFIVPLDAHQREDLSPQLRAQRTAGGKRYFPGRESVEGHGIRWYLSWTLKNRYLHCSWLNLVSIVHSRSQLSKIPTMSHPSWLPPKSTGEPLGHVPARMETTHSFGNPSISVSTQQPPKKFAPVVAPKPKYNPYKQPGGEGDFLPPPPPPLDDSSALPSISGNFPPPPPLDEEAFKVQQGNPGGKTLEERRSSLDAEIDSLTSILADLECSSPYKPRPPQSSTGSTASPPVSTPVTGHKRMVIPNQPPLTATKKSTLKPQPAPQAGPIPVAPIGTLKPQPQPVPASYTTASTSSRPTFNVQVKSAQPSPHYMAAPSSGQMYGSGPQGYNTQPVPVSGQCPPPSTRGGMDYAYIPPPGLQPEPGYGYTPNQGRYYEGYYAAGPGYGGRNDSDPAYGQQGHPNTWKREPGYTPPGAGNQNPPGMYPVTGPKKTYITDPVSAPCAPPLQSKREYKDDFMLRVFYYQT
ncbi:lipoma-preferred partner isoform X8 [Papio anubis]|uniref:lipoma-preferred partner isoform X8 n=1 Tax=Papio anubis TaxID=9555 RepID=UPI0012AD3087|nr:lipoma-preferred partner isoform X8 [Papio anubis]